jgi:glucokinase
MLIPIRSADTRHLSPKPFTILAGDIGATKTNLAVFQFSGKGFSILKENKYPTKDFSNADEVIDKFLAGDHLPDRISLGVAGPVQNGKVSITNVVWQLNSGELSERYNKPVCLINDLEAAAYGLAMLEEKDIRTVYEPAQKTDGNIALIAPGTGLGEAGLYWDGSHYYPFATEGGHCDFAPRTEMDAELYFHLHRKFGHVSWERLVSGAGIVSIFEFLRDKKAGNTPSWLAEKMLAHDPAAVISEYAEEIPVCGETIELFFRFLATEASNLALKLKATGGVYIGGGIVPKIIRLLDADHFLKWFRDAGRMKPLLKTMPVKIILNERTALLGAAYYGAFN